jgi:proline iminopeptidase
MPDGLARRALFPPLEPFARGRMAVTGGHDIYFEQCGTPGGKPVVVLHGGPGGGSSPFLRRFHDPAHYHIILFDQRGCGQSTPHGGLEANTTWDLVADIEALRQRLGFERWQVFGGSWGSTLALAYAQTHPTRVTELVLRGIFLIRDFEVRWLYQDGASRIFPEAFSAFRDMVPEAERHDLMQAYYRRFHGSDAGQRLSFAGPATGGKLWRGPLRPGLRAD